MKRNHGYIGRLLRSTPLLLAFQTEARLPVRSVLEPGAADHPTRSADNTFVWSQRPGFGWCCIIVRCMLLLRLMRPTIYSKCVAVIRSILGRWGVNIHIHLAPSAPRLVYNPVLYILLRGGSATWSERVCAAIGNIRFRISYIFIPLFPCDKFL